MLKHSKAQPLFTRLRQWLILRLAGQMGVVLNASLGKDERGQPFIAYAGTKGGLCAREGVK